jgi:hypothetical protein
MARQTRKTWGYLKWTALILSLPAWVMFVADTILESSQIDRSATMHLGKMLFLVACLGCSPTSVVMFLLSFRGTPGIAHKVFWIIWSGIPILFGFIASVAVR